MLGRGYLKHDWNPMMKGVLPSDEMEVWITIELPNGKRAVRQARFSVHAGFYYIGWGDINDKIIAWRPMTIPPPYFDDKIYND